MSVSTPPPPPAPKKGGMGCLGCGCLILALLAVLLLGLVATTGYMGYTKVIVPLTSTTAASIPTFDGGDEMYNAAAQKVTGFKHDLTNHQAATIHLSANEINTLIARSPVVTQNHMQCFVTFSHNLGRVQASLPTDRLSYGLLKNRYINFDVTSELNFDPQTKSINLTPQSLQFGDRSLLGPNSNNTSSGADAGFNQGFMNSFTPAFNQSFNNSFRQTPDGQALLDHAKSIEIKDGELVIEIE